MSKGYEEIIREHLAYDPESGEIYWIKRSGSQRKVGDRAGCSKHGYRIIKLAYKDHQEHRVAWLLYYGEWPSLPVDHIDGDPANNRISNLRLATPSLNGANSKPRKRPYPKGVSPTPSGTFRACIMVNRKQIPLGTHPTVDLAHAAYCDAASRLFGEFARVA